MLFDVITNHLFVDVFGVYVDQGTVHPAILHVLEFDDHIPEFVERLFEYYDLLNDRKVGLFVQTEYLLFVVYDQFLLHNISIGN